MHPIDSSESAGEMESYEMLSRIIPRGRAQTVAHYMHCSVDYVRRWSREPGNEEGTGQPNPVDRVCHLIDSVFLVNPLGAAFIPEFIVNHHRQLVRTHEMAGFSGSDAQRDAAAEVLERAVSAVNSLNVGGANDHTLCQLVELNETCARVIATVQAELAQRGTIQGTGQNRER
jgi:hypothetical protein